LNEEEFANFLQAFFDSLVDQISQDVWNYDKTGDEASMHNKKDKPFFKFWTLSNHRIDYTRDGKKAFDPCERYGSLYYNIFNRINSEKNITINKFEGRVCRDELG
jgi:hypothetical protein